MKSKSGERTLLASVLMSSPGPIVVGTALFLAARLRSLQTLYGVRRN